MGKFILNKISIIFVLTLTWISIPAHAWAGETVDWTPVPDWVSDTPIPEPVEEHLDTVSGGIYYLLTSRQYRLDGARRVDFLRNAKTVVNRSGLEASSTIQIEFRPGFETLEFHRLAIHRGNETVDLTGKVEFEIFRRETELHDGVLDGRLTAYADLPQIKVGDIIETAYSRSYTPILMPDHFSSLLRESFSDPSARIETVFSMPEKLKASYAVHGASGEPEITNANGFTTYRWSRSGVPGTESGNSPDWFVPYDLVEISTVKSWRDVAESMLAHYPDDRKLPEPIIAKLEAIKAESADKKRWVSDVLKLVQAEVRYVGIEIGRGAFVPRDPETVFALGYGDCKDKAYLMATALQWLGIDAAPALVNSSTGAFLGTRLPTPYAFDHAIVRVRLGNAVYWLDPTSTYQFSPDPAHSQANFGYALPIAEDTEGLEPIEPTILYEPLTVTTETFTLGYGEEMPPLTLNVESRYRGADADNFRRSLASRGAWSIQRSYLDYYQDRYDVKVSRKMSIRDDADRNEIIVVEKYVSAHREDMDDLFSEFPIVGDAVRSQLWDADARLQQPVRVDYPLFREHHVRIKNLKTDLAPAEGSWTTTTYLDFSFGSSATEHELSLDWRLRTKRDHVEVDEVDDYADLVEAINWNTVWYYDVRAKEEAKAEDRDNM